VLNLIVKWSVTSSAIRWIQINEHVALKSTKLIGGRINKGLNI
jgi:hypothetical protein